WSTPSSSIASSSASASSRKSLKSRNSASTSGCTSRVVSIPSADVSRSSAISSPSCASRARGVLASLTTMRTWPLAYTALANGHRLSPITARSSQRRTPRSTASGSKASSVTEVVELQRQAEVLTAQQRDRSLQVVALLAGHAQLVAVDLAVDLEPGFLELALDLLRQLAVDALAHRDLLPRAGHVGLDVAELQAAGVDLPRDQARAQDVGHLLQLELAGRGLGDDRVLAHELRVHALEVEAVGQLAVGLVDGVDQLVGVDFGNDIEGRHGRFRSRGWVRGRSTSRRARTGYSMVTHATEARGGARRLGVAAPLRARGPPDA